jgi:hypothetical protein
VHADLAKARKQGRIGGRPRLVLDYKKVLGRSADIDSSHPEGTSPPCRRCDSLLKHARIFVSLFFGRSISCAASFHPTFHFSIRLSFRALWSRLAALAARSERHRAW